MEYVDNRLCVQFFTVLSLIAGGAMDVFVVYVLLKIPDWLGCFVHGVVLSMYVMENWVLLTELENSKTECIEKYRKTIYDMTRENIRLEAEQAYLRARLSDHLKLRQENTDLRSHHGRLRRVIAELRSQLINFKKTKQNPTFQSPQYPLKSPLNPQGLNCISCWRRRWNTHPDLRLFFHPQKTDCSTIDSTHPIKQISDMMRS
jgi:regulator of replication initiation timing